MHFNELNAWAWLPWRTQWAICWECEAVSTGDFYGDSNTASSMAIGDVDFPKSTMDNFWSSSEQNKVWFSLMYKAVEFLEKSAYIKAVQKFCNYMLNWFRSGPVGFSPTWIFYKTFKVTWNYQLISGHLGPCLASKDV